MSEMQTENGIAGDSMDSSQDVSVKMLLMGLPAAPVIGGITSSFLLSHFVYPALMLYLAITFSGAYLWRRHLSKSHSLALSFDSGGPIKNTILVRGAPQDTLTRIRSITEDNRLVVITCPADKMLRRAVGENVYRMGGFAEFQTGDSFELSSKPLGKRSLILSYRSKETLQNSMSHLMQRGWRPYGEQGKESSLIDRVYTQTMLYGPRDESTSN